MESALVVKLCTRLAPDNHTYNNNAAVPGLYDDDGYHSEEMSHLTSGIQKLWRKGKEQYVELQHARRVNKIHPGSSASAQSSSAAVVVTQKEQQAANVAQFLMKTGSVGSEQRGGGGGLAAASGVGEGGIQQGFLVDYQQKWTERKGDRGSSTTGTGIIHNFDDDSYATSGGSSSMLMGAVKEKKTNDDNAADDNLHYSEGLCLGTLTIPFNKLPLEDAVCGNGAAVVERWYQLDDPNFYISSPKAYSAAACGGGDASLMTSGGNADRTLDGSNDNEPTLLHGPRRCPSVLLEITFASADFLDAAEDEIYEGGGELGGGTKRNKSVLDLSSLHNEGEGEEKECAPALSIPFSSNEDEVTGKSKKKKGKAEVKKPEEPELEPGVVDFVCIIGARDIGDQKNDDGSKGWVKSTPECCVLERFPPDDDFHVNNGRMTGLIPQVEWFCFPEGCKLWRGPNAPTQEDLKAGGVSTMSHPSMDFSSSNFDTCLNTASSFSWFVLSSNSDVYGSKLIKTYGTIVRFYVPAPKGVDPRQDDFAQMLTGGEEDDAKLGNYQKRLWVPIGICLTTVRIRLHLVSFFFVSLALFCQQQLLNIVPGSLSFLRRCRLSGSSKKSFCVRVMQCNHR
jgi:hypothetical protein